MIRLVLPSSFIFALTLVTAARGESSPLSRQSNAAIAEAVQTTLERQIDPAGPGAAVLIADARNVIFRGARGRANLELGVPLNPDQVFRIASVTKMFTAAAILKLAESGKLSLDDPLAKYFPDAPSSAGITIRELLNHTAGVSDVAKDPQPGYSRRDLDLQSRVASLLQRPLTFPPGTGWAYSNSGFMLLGAVIERVTGKPWAEAYQDLLFEPLGLKQTRFDERSRLMPGRVAGYTTDPSTHAVSNAPYISMTLPATAGALVSSVDDLWLWMRALTSGRVVKTDSFQQMVTPGPILPGASPAHRYGLGMYLWRVRGETVIGHTGQIDGFASAVGYLPGRGIIVVVLANDDTFDAQTLSRRLAAIALGDPYPEAISAHLSDEQSQALAGTYQFDPSTFETLTVRDHTLYAQRGRGHAIPLQLAQDGLLHFMPDELSCFTPIFDAAGRITRLDYFENGDGPPRPLCRIP